MKMKWESILLFLLVAVSIFNVIDYFVTMQSICRGFVEGNPVINAILHTPFFPLLKIVVIPLALFFIWQVRRHIGKRLILYVSGMFVCYLSLMVYFGIVVLP